MLRFCVDFGLISMFVEEWENLFVNGSVHPLSLNLYELDEGYTVTIPGSNCKDVTTQTFQYDDRDLLLCFEDGQLPWFLADLLQHCSVNVYHKGCVAVQVVDHRHPPFVPIGRLLVLRPSALSLTSDLDQLLSDPGLDSAQRLELESKFWKLVCPNVFLSNFKQDGGFWTPDSAAYRKANRRRLPYRILHRKRNNELSLQRTATFFQSCLAFRSATTLAVSDISTDNDHIDSVDDLRKCNAILKVGDQWKPMVAETKTPIELAICKVEERRRKERNDNNDFDKSDLTLLEEITVLMPVPSSTAQHSTRISICTHKRTGAFWGELKLRLENGPTVYNGPFLLGIDWDAKMYVLQYLEMITEGGRRQPISVIRRSPGRPPTMMTSKV